MKTKIKELKISLLVSLYKTKTHFGKLKLFYLITLMTISSLITMGQANVIMSYSLPAGYPTPDYYSPCFNDLPIGIFRELTVRLDFSNFSSTSCPIIFTCPSGAYITGFLYVPSTVVTTPLGPIPPANTNSIVITAPTVTSPAITGYLTMKVKISGCEVFHSANYSFTASCDCATSGLSAGTVTTQYRCTLPVPSPPNPTDEMCVKIHTPAVGFVATNTSLTTPSHMDEYFLKYDIIDRFYQIIPTEGIVDYFTLDITPEPDIQILAIDAVDPVTGTTRVSFGAVTNIVFDNGTIRNCLGTLFQSYLREGSGDAILIRERIQITKVTNCDPLPNNSTSYHLAVHCDHTPSANTECTSVDATLNVNCEVQTPNLTLDLNNGQTPPALPVISSCGSTTNYSAHITNVAPVPNSHPGSGTIEITKISFYVNPDYFTFDASPGGIHVGTQAVAFSNPGGLGHITIDLSSLTSSGGTDLNIFLDPNPSYQNTYFTTNYVFLREGGEFSVTLQNIKFIGCTNGKIKLCDATFDLSDADFHIEYNTMCEMENHSGTHSVASDISDFWRVKSNFISSTSASSNSSPDMVNGSHALITYTCDQGSANALTLPWDLRDNNSAHLNFIPCDNAVYQAVLTFPNYYAISGNVNISDPDVDPSTSTYHPTLTTTIGASVTQVLIDWSDPSIILTNRSTVSLLIDIQLSYCTGVHWGRDDISIEFRAVCDPAPACSTCYRAYGCAVWPLYNHCGVDCNGTVIKTETGDFSFERTTLGWTDQTSYENDPGYDSPNQIRSVLSTAEVQRVYECDVVHINCIGTIAPGLPATTSHLNFDLEYIPPSGSTHNLFEFVGSPAGGSSTAGRLTVTPLNGVAVIVPIYSNQVIFTNDHPNYSGSGYTLHIQPALTTISTLIQSPCSLRFEGDFRVTEHTNSPIANGQYIIQAYSYFTFFDGTNTTPDPSCDQNSTNITYYKVSPIIDNNGLVGPGDYLTQGFPYLGDGSELRYVLFTNVIGGRPLGQGIDEFPNEYRPILRWPNQVTIRVPHNAFYMNTVNLADPLNPHAGYATTQPLSNPGGFAPQFPGSTISLWGSYRAPNCPNVSLNNTGMTEDIIVINDLNLSGYPLSVDKKNALPSQGLVVYLTRNCPIEDQATHYLGDDAHATVIVDNSGVNHDINIITHAYSPEASCQGVLKLCADASTSPCSFHYDASAGEYHKLNLAALQSPIIATTNPLILPFGFSHSGTGYKFSNMWTYFTAHAASPGNPTFTNFTQNYFSYVNHLAGAEMLHEVSNNFYRPGGIFPNSFAVSNTYPGAGGNLSLSYTCTALNGGYDTISFRCNYGNSCDGYHALSSATGNASDFAASYIPCLFQNDNFTIRPQRSNLYVTMGEPTPSGCNVDFDFSVTSNGKGVPSNVVLNIRLEPGFTLDQSGLTTVSEILPSAAGPHSPVVSFSGQTISINVSSDWLAFAGAAIPFSFNSSTGTYGQLNYHLHFNGSGATSGNPTFIFSLEALSPCADFPNQIFPQPFPFTACTDVSSTSHPVSCHGGNDGTATAIPPLNAITPITYLWSGGATTQTISGISAGTYTVTVTDNSPHVWTTSVTVVEPPALTASTTLTQPLCFGDNNGIATVNVSGGTPLNNGPPYYSYLWNTTPPQTSEFASGLADGSYTCTVTDAKNCSLIVSVTIIQPDAITATYTTTSVSCNGGGDGTATIMPSGGTPGYFYNWSTGANTATATNLASANYSCMVEDAQGCITTINNIFVGQVPALVLSPSLSNVTCFAGNNGQASVTVSGGTAGYSYQWSTGSSLSSISGLIAGTYTVIVTDNNSCHASHVFQLSDGSPSCCGNAANDFPRFPTTATVTSGLSYNVNQSLNTPVEISGNVLLNGNTLYLAEGEKIIVHSGATLTLTRCHLKACLNMWQGIWVENGGNINLTETIIEDAEFAVHMIGVGNLQVAKSHFVNNFTGIQYEEGFHSGVFSVNGTDFKGTGVMAPPYPNQPTAAYIHIKPMVGIMIDDFNVNINSLGNSPNSFENMICGIISVNSQVFVHNAAFKNIFADAAISTGYHVHDNIPVTEFEGCGIYAEDRTFSGSLTVQGFGLNSSDLNFDACQTGIKASTIDVHIYNCRMGFSAGNPPTETGIQFQYSYLNTADVGYNYINASLYGVNMEMNEGALELNVHDNIIDIDDAVNPNSQNAGIRFSNFSQINTNHSFIYGNSINMNNHALNGIEVNNFNLPVIEQNTINFSSNATQEHGIHISQSDRSDVSCNHISSTDNAYSNPNQAAVDTPFFRQG